MAIAGGDVRERARRGAQAKKTAANRNTSSASAVLIRLTISGAAALAATPAFAVEPAGEKVTNLETVVVVGSRRADQTRLTSVSPIDVVSGDQLTRSGSTSLSKVLQELLPSFNYPQNNVTNHATLSVRSASLRGLSPDETLILVNGKRRHKSALVAPSGLYGSGANVSDLDTIPISAVERIEVLRDGASALYGSDAIAGVINVVLKGAKPEQGGINAQVGQFSKGDGLRKSVNGYYGIGLADEGFVTLSFDGFDNQKAYNATSDTRQMYFAGDPREASFDRKWFYGSGASDKIALGVNSEVAITERLRGYAFATYADTSNTSIGFLRRPSETNNYRPYYPDGFQPGQDTLGEDLSVTTGLKFDTAGHGAFDVSVNYARHEVDQKIFNSVNTSMGSNSPTRFYRGGLVNDQLSGDVEYKRPFEIEGLAGPLEFAAGFGYRREHNQTRPGDPESYINGGVPIVDGPSAGAAAPSGAQGYTGFQLSDAGSVKRDVFVGYVGLENQITEQLQAGLAARYERYSDFGDATTGKLSARYDFAPAFAVRGAISTGFRAPSLAQENFSVTTTYFTNGVPFQIATLPVNSPVSRALGASDLKAEKSLNLSFGFVWRPVRDVSVTVDAYQIDIDDRLTFTDSLTGPFVISALQSAGITDYTSVAFFTNGLDTRTRGVDLVANYDTELVGNPLKLSAGVSVVNTTITDLKDVPPILQGSGLQLVGVKAQTIVTDSTPRDKLKLNALYTVGAFDINAAVTRYGEYIDATNIAIKQKFSPQWIANLDLGYRFTEQLSAKVGASNLFNSHPDKINVAGRNPVVYEYSPFAPEGAFGTYVYAGVDYSF